MLARLARRRQCRPVSRGAADPDPALDGSPLLIPTSSRLNSLSRIFGTMATKPSIGERISGFLNRRVPESSATAPAHRSNPEPFQFHYRQTKAESGALDPVFALGLAKAFGLTAFIETGTYRGDTLWPLLDGFEALISIELDDALHVAATERFKDQTHVSLLRGNSAEMLKQAVSMVEDSPALVWLDAHFSGVGTAFGGTNTPVYDELDAIFASNRPRDVVLIDDLRCFRQLATGFLTHASLDEYPLAEDVAARLQAHGYTVFVLCDSLVAIPDSLVASVRPSPVLQACTRLRLEQVSEVERLALENDVAGATAQERASLVSLPSFIQGSVPYGLGGDYYYWRSLVLASDDPEKAREDRDFARRCGVVQ